MHYHIIGNHTQLPIQGGTMRHAAILTLMSAGMALSVAHADHVKVVAAESVYGDLAQQIGGSDVAVTSVLTGSDQDPHDFEPSASTARQIGDARLVIHG
jgi:zinc/manganese transport system substrate-binding protein